MPRLLRPQIGVDYVQQTNRYVFLALKSTCSYVKNSLFFGLYLEVFFQMTTSESVEQFEMLKFNFSFSISSLTLPI